MSNIRRNFFDRRAGCLAPVAEQAAVAARQRRRRGVGAARRAVLGKVADDVAQDSSILDRFGAWLRAAMGRVPNGDHLATRDVNAAVGEVMVADAYGNAVGSGRFVSASSGVSGSVPARTTNGVLSNTASSATNGAVTGVNPGGSGDTAGVVGIGDSGTHGLMGMAFAPGYHAVFGFAPFPGFVSAIDQQGKLVFFGSSAASNRNAQLKELFQSMPTSDPFVAGELWNDGGVVKISSG